ncbi:uncharacterized protein [Syngnathus scovelli]|uniref:uncharacterized protein isoform X2 n=1 Tax=Syngnathus scovelli TaxID=161590 RepID=UPI00210F2C5C|nr:uncharacterized protein LOC125994749 isoform X2 [Syngnathus scovelli]
MVKDITVFADVHASFDDDSSGVYLTQSDYDLVAAASRQNEQPTQADSETQTLVQAWAINFYKGPHEKPEEASTDTELAEALSAYEGLNHPHELTNKVGVKRRDTGRGVRRGRGGGGHPLQHEPLSH